ncbi:MAG: type II toxin-antitoxin system RatA family toxin [Proteobacteria bacterium]|nr:type II toxin-antitoxin system RatA family toxin [Pseudomonadota bacterium]
MTHITKQALVPYQATDLLALVNDVEKYPEFLKWCIAGNIHQQNDSGYEAGLDIQIKGIKVKFVTKNSISTIVVDDKKIIQLDMQLLKGPFKNLSGNWRFTQLSDVGSKIELKLDYHFKYSSVGVMFAKGFDKIAHGMVSDFVHRAGVLYAKN